MTVFGMIQTPIELNCLVKTIPRDLTERFVVMLECEITKNSTLTKPELEEFLHLEQHCSWDKAPMEYSPVVDVNEVQEQYNDVRIENPSLDWSQVQSNPMIDSDHDHNFDPICDLCGSKIENQVYEVEPQIDKTLNFRSSSDYISPQPVNLYSHRSCFEYLTAAVCEGVNRNFDQIMSTVI